tara:strand:- start:133 stop:363 length:231 start_codon:yes stop_codon:yes gene_type:complete
MKEEWQKIEGDNNFVRDKNTGTILNINRNDILAARKRKELLKSKENEMESMKESISKLENDNEEIKSLLNKIVEKL